MFAGSRIIEECLFDDLPETQRNLGLVDIIDELIRAGPRGRDNQKSLFRRCRVHSLCYLHAPATRENQTRKTSTSPSAIAIPVRRNPPDQHGEANAGRAADRKRYSRHGSSTSACQMPQHTRAAAIKAMVTPRDT